MKQRCLNPKNETYHHYGGRNITICERWKNSFENFLEDMGEAPENMVLDRINNEGNYEPENCRWATYQQSIVNRRATVWIEYNGKTYYMKELANVLGVGCFQLKTWCVIKKYSEEEIERRIQRNRKLKQHRDWSKQMASS